MEAVCEYLVEDGVEIQKRVIDGETLGMGSTLIQPSEDSCINRVA